MLPSRFITWLGYVLNLKNSFILLFLLLFNLSSFGQSNGFTLDCLSGESTIIATITFSSTSEGVGVYNGYPYWIGGTDTSPGTDEYLLFVQVVGTPRWEVHKAVPGVNFPTDPTIGELFFYSNVIEGTLFCDNTWLNVVGCDSVGITCWDRDNDSFKAPADCDDNDNTIYPGAPELCDGLDNDCDNDIDEDVVACEEVIPYCNEDKTKVLICHNGNTICVSTNAKDAHLEHGDDLGECEDDPYDGEIYSKSNAGKPNTSVVGFNVRVWPNPSESNYNIKIATADNLNAADVQVIDITGKLVHNAHINWNENYKFGSDLESGVYFVKITQGNNTQVKKVIKR